MRSFCFLVEFRTEVPVFRTPEYTRTKDRRPTKGSVAILKARAEKGASSLAGRSSSSSVSGLTPLMAGMSTGEGM